MVRPFDERDMRPWPDRPRLLKDLDAFRAELFDRGCQILRDDSEVVVRVAELEAVASHPLARAGAPNEEVDSVQPHLQIDGPDGFGAGDRLRAEHLTIKALRCIQVAAHQVYVIEPKLQNCPLSRLLYSSACGGPAAASPSPTPVGHARPIATRN